MAVFFNGFREWLLGLRLERGYQNVFNRFRVLNTATIYNTYYEDIQKLQMVLTSPAALKVFCLQCDLFSLGRVEVKDKKGKVIDNDPFMLLLQQPNPFQTQSQFLWDYCFWLMLGNSYTYCNSRVLDSSNKLYHLEPSKLQFPADLLKKSDQFIFSDAEFSQRNKQTITYRYRDGSTFSFPLDRMIISSDLTNGLGNFYKGNSRVDALYKIISNSEHALDSKNINLRYAGKFLVGSNNDAAKLGLSEDEKTDIINKMETNDKRVFPLKTMVEIRRFVENMKVLELGTAFQEDFFTIGGLYNIPKDVLEAYLKSSTFENQEKARMAHVTYTLQPKGEQWMDSFEKHFGYNKEGKTICISWDHLPMMGIFKNDDATAKNMNVQTFTAMRSAGIPLEEVNEYLGTEFTEEEPKPEQNGQGKKPNSTSGQASGQGQGQGGSGGVDESQESNEPESND